MGKSDRRNWWQSPMQVPPPDLAYGADSTADWDIDEDGAVRARQAPHAHGPHAHGPTIPGAVLAGGKTASDQGAQGFAHLRDAARLASGGTRPLWSLTLGRLSLIWQASAPETAPPAPLPPPQPGRGRK